MLKRTWVVALTSAALMVGLAAPAEAGTANRREYERVHRGMTKHRVSHIMDQRGRVVWRNEANMRMRVRYRSTHRRVHYYVVYSYASLNWWVERKYVVSGVPGADGCTGSPC